MKPLFVHDLTNVNRFLAGITIVKKRGAAEASMMLVTSDPGFGKTRTLHWYVTQEPNAVYVRCKAGYTRAWFLRDLVKELGLTPGRTSEENFILAIRGLSGTPTDKHQPKASRTQEPGMLLVDELDHAMGDSKTLETIRDLADLTEIPVVLSGMEKIKEKIRSVYPQITSRIAKVVPFLPVSVEDIQTAARCLLEGVEIAPDLADEIHRLCEGRMRMVMNAFAVIENIAKARKASCLSMADMEGIELIHDWRGTSKVRVHRLRHA